jgi:hypothetical protein
MKKKTILILAFGILTVAMMYCSYNLGKDAAKRDKAIEKSIEK